MTWALKIFKVSNLIGSFCVKYVWPKKSIEELSVMTLKSDAKFEEKLTCGLDNDMRNMANFHQNTWMSQNWDFDVILLSKLENFWELCFTIINNGAKFKEELTCCFKSKLIINNAPLACVYPNTIKTFLTSIHLWFRRQLLCYSNTTSAVFRNLTILSGTTNKINRSSNHFWYFGIDGDMNV